MNERDVAAAIELLMAAYRSDEHPNGLNGNSLADAVNERFGAGTTSQTAIWRILTRTSAQPRDSSLEPVARFFGIPVPKLRDYDHIEMIVNTGAMSEPDKLRVINEIYELLLDESLEGCLAVRQILRRG